MKHISSICFISVVALFSATTVVHSQNIKKDQKNNSVEAYFGICHYFDQSETNWTILVPAQRAKAKWDKVIPNHYGLIYSYKIKDSSSIRVSGFLYWMHYSGPYDTGQIRDRQYYLFSIGYKYQLLNYQKLGINSLFELKYRYGGEIIHIYKPYYWESRVGYLDVNDIGLSVGYKLEYRLPFNFFISNEVTYTRYIYRYSKGIEFFGRIKRSTPNTLTIKLGLGYEF